MCLRTPSLCDSAVLTLACVSLLAVALVRAAPAEPLLAEAAEQRDWRRMEALLASRADVNTPQADGATALHWAAYWEQYSAVDALIRAGANVNVANDLGVTPLALAAENRAARIVERLLATGANPNVKSARGETALMTAARAGSAAVVEALLARGAAVNVAEPVHQQTALMWAAAERHADVVRLLAEHGADVHARSRVRRRTIVAAGRFGDQKSIGGITETDFGGFTPLLFAARSGDVESARHLLDAGARVDESAANGTTPLVVAAHSGNGAVAAFLLSRGANPNRADAGYTALHAAVLRADLDLVQALLRHGGAVDARLAKGTPARFYSKDYAFSEVMIGATPLWLAARYGEPQIMRVLAAAGADPNAALPDGTTAIMAAILPTRGTGAFRVGDRRERYLGAGDMALRPDAEDEAITYAAVSCAIELGADVTAANKAGDTALHLAAAVAANRVIELLAGRGAGINARNHRGHTPLAASLAPPVTGPGITYGVLNVNARVGTADLLRKLGGIE